MEEKSEVCPICDSLIPEGDDICPLCGKSMIGDDL